MRNRRFGAHRTGRGFVDQQGLPLCQAICAASSSRCGCDMPSNTQQWHDRRAHREIGPQVGHIDVGLVAGGKRMTDRHTAFNGLASDCDSAPD